MNMENYPITNKLLLGFTNGNGDLIQTAACFMRPKTMMMYFVGLPYHNIMEDVNQPMVTEYYVQMKIMSIHSIVQLR